MKVHGTNHVANFRDMCLRTLLPPTTSLPTFPVHCNGLNSIRATQMALCGLVTDFVANISTCQDGLRPRLLWFVSATCPQGSFGESPCNGIWTLAINQPDYRFHLWLQHSVIRLFTSQILLVLILPTYQGMARLSRPGWLITYRNGLPICWSFIKY